MCIVTPCIALGGCHRFGGFCYSYLQGRRSVQTADKIMSQRQICSLVTSVLFETYEGSVINLGNILRFSWTIFSPDVGIFVTFDLELCD